MRNEVQLGFKQVKWLKGIEFVANFDEIGGGYGGYNEDHEFFGYRHPCDPTGRPVAGQSTSEAQAEPSIGEGRIEDLNLAS